MTPDLEKLRRHMEERLTPGRYRHCLAVQKAASRLAGRHGADWFKASVAGLVHDVCRDMDHEEQLNYLRSCGILPDILTLEHPSLWHAIAGAHYAREVLGIEDGDILNAVRYHTTGRREMSRLEMVIYMADLTSEDRAFEDAPMLRRMADQSLEAAVRYCLRYTLHKVVRESKPIVGDAYEAYNYYILEKGPCE